MGEATEGLRLLVTRVKGDSEEMWTLLSVYDGWEFQVHIREPVTLAQAAAAFRTLARALDEKDARRVGDGYGERGTEGLT